MILETLPAVQNLSRKEKLILASELTDEYQSMPEDESEMRETIMTLVSQRMEHLEEHPDSAVTLEEFRRKVQLIKSGE